MQLTTANQYGKSSTGHSAMTRRVSFANPDLYPGDESDTGNYNIRTVLAKESQSCRSDKYLSKELARSQTDYSLAILQVKGTVFR